MGNSVKINALEARLYLIDKKLNKANLRLADIDVKIKLRGIIFYKYIKCGKKTCYCSNGFGHGPYPHLQWYEKGKTKMKYLNKKNYHIYEEELKKNKEVDKLQEEIEKLNNKREEIVEKINSKNRLTRKNML